MAWTNGDTRGWGGAKGSGGSSGAARNLDYAQTKGQDNSQKGFASSHAEKRAQMRQNMSRKGTMDNFERNPSVQFR
jgi:hypothetical protein